jgi:hypothetical protein
VPKNRGAKRVPSFESIKTSTPPVPPPKLPKGLRGGVGGDYVAQGRITNPNPRVPLTGLGSDQKRKKQ